MMRSTGNVQGDREPGALFRPLAFGVGGIAIGAALAYRGEGLVAGIRGRVADIGQRMRGDVPDDDVVVARVRSRLGRVCSHPRAIEVSCADGHVAVHGPILRSEVDRVLRAVSAVRGVRAIDDELEVHASAEGIPALQGGSRRPGHRLDVLQENWAPSTRLLVGAAGVALTGWGLRERTPISICAGIAGVGLLARSLFNLPARRLVGAGAGGRAIQLRKDIHVDASPREVFAFFEQFENFPLFMEHVQKVVPQGGGDRQRRWRWTVGGPAGIPVSWDATLTRYSPDRVIAWRSLGGSPIRNAGIVRFDPDRGGTRVSIRLAYNPPAGALGHAVAAAFGVDPKKQMDDDMVRFKSLLELGKTTGRDDTVTRDELRGAPA